MTQSQEMQLLTSHKTVEWYTPRWFIDLVRSTIGPIDLDPAAAALSQEWIQANQWWTEEGLERDWVAGTVFCNPPYGKTKNASNQHLWAQKMDYEYKCRHFQAGILLVNSTPGYAWWEWITREYPVCLLRDRIKFIKEDGTEGGQAKRGQTVVYMGPFVNHFNVIFNNCGRILWP